MPLSRISITLPAELVRAADERAAALERSRSWVVADALRRGLGPDAAGPGATPIVRVAAGPPDGAAGASGLGGFREAQLEADLRLSPEQRVKEAERTARVAEVKAPKRSRGRVLTFDRFEDYLDWQRQEDLAR